MARIPYSEEAVGKASEATVGSDLASPDAGIPKQKAPMRLMRVKEFAAFYGVSESTVRAWIRDGKVKYLQPGCKNGAIFIPVAEK